jgi:NAD-dependent deacetylase
MERIVAELQRCTRMVVVGTSGVVQPAASFVRWARMREGKGEAAVKTYYVGPEHPANAGDFSEVVEGRAAEMLPQLFQF